MPSLVSFGCTAVSVMVGSCVVTSILVAVAMRLLRACLQAGAIASKIRPPLVLRQPAFF
jgi:hypothetical protein